MAAIHSSFNMASTPSTSSQSSLPPSYAISVHDHVLPPGWQCKCDPKTGRYYFLHDHLAQQWDYRRPSQSSSHSSRSSSPSHTFTSYGRYFPSFSRYKVSDFRYGESGYQKIVQQFPQVDESYISHLMRTYHQRENLVISALLSEGYTRHLHPPPDESLFYKLKSYFPNVDSDKIRQLLVKHNNVEHEVIAAIIKTLGPYHARYQTRTTGSPKMKLRYLKLVYPEADEAVLFDMLSQNEQNAQEVMNKLEQKGYKKSSLIRPTFLKIPESSKSSTALFGQRQWKFPPNTTEKQKLFNELQEAFPNVNRTLINMALESTTFDVERAKILLAAMTPQDSDKYLPKDIKPVHASPLLSRMCRGTQTNTVFGCVSGTPIRIRKISAEKETIGTSTYEDGIIIEDQKKPLAKGTDPSLRKGANIMNLIKSYLPWKTSGPDSKNRRGPDQNNRKGPDFSYKKDKYIPKGAEPIYRKGPFEKLLSRKKKEKTIL